MELYGFMEREKKIPSYFFIITKQSKAKQLFASRNFHYSLLLFTIWYLCDYSFYEGERLLHDEAI